MEVIARLAGDESLGDRVMKVNNAGEHVAVGPAHGAPVHRLGSADSQSHRTRLARVCVASATSGRGKVRDFELLQARRLQLNRGIAGWVEGRKGGRMSPGDRVPCASPVRS
jgi:hypothetical protein